MKPLRRYEFSERLADLLGESRRDLRVRVTLMVTAGLFPPGARGPGSPPASPEEAANLLLGVLAAPQQVHTVAAVECYRALEATSLSADATMARILSGPEPAQPASAPAPVAPAPGAPALPGGERFGEALARLLAAVHDPAGARALIAGLFGIWVSRGFPVAGVQRIVGAAGRRALLTQRYELPDGARPPAWLDPERGGTADPGLIHTVFLPAARLIEIGRLTAPAAARPSVPSTPLPSERSHPVLDLGNTLNDVAGLARRVGHRKPWKNFLAKAGEALETLEALDPSTSPLTEVAIRAANPGNLRMTAYVPDDLPDGAALVVILHGCTQTAASYDYGTGWTTLADRHGFAVLAPEQKRANNPLRCFNWFKAEDTGRDGGEAASIRAMIDQLCSDHALDRRRVFVTGVSAGGAMTAALLATHPELFAGGAIIAGVPYRSAEGLQDAFEVIFQGRSRPDAEWGGLVRAASPHAGPWPTLSVWHGDADATVTPQNAEELIKQWRNVHGLDAAPTIEDTVDGHRRRTWQGDDGRDLIAAYTVAGMTHGVPIRTDGPDGCGVPGPFIIDAGISSTHHIARSWGLTETVREPRARCRPAASAPKASPWSEQPADAVVALAATGAERDGARADARFRDRGAETEGPGGVDLAAVLARSFEAAGLLERARRAAPGASAAPRPAGAAGRTAATVAGVDIGQILTTSFQAAGLLKPDPEGSARPQPSGGGPLGIDIPGILAASFEAAGLGRGRMARPAAPTAEPAPDPEPAQPEPAKPAAAPKPASEPPAGGADTGTHSPAAGPAGAVPGWDGEGWQLLPGEGRGAEAAPTLYGHAVSGSGGAIERAVRTVSCRLSLGDGPRLSYRRRLNLRAAVNPFTRADFTVLVDGEVVDTVSAAGMDHAEFDWTERGAIDLTRFAGREVTLAFEIAASTNVFVEVSAEAWVRDIRVGRSADA